jgi:hypothetical protein
MYVACVAYSYFYTLFAVFSCAGYIQRVRHVPMKGYIQRVRHVPIKLFYS